MNPSRVVRRFQAAQKPRLENLCPVCGQAAVVTCKCMIGDSTCAQGHEWHHYEGQVHLGHSDHGATDDHTNCVVVP